MYSYYDLCHILPAIYHNNSAFALYVAKLCFQFYSWPHPDRAGEL